MVSDSRVIGWVLLIVPLMFLVREHIPSVMYGGVHIPLTIVGSACVAVGLYYVLRKDR